MKRFDFACASVVAFLSLGGAASGDLVSFDDLGPGVKVTNQYPSVTFSTEQGQANWTDAFNGEIILCTGDLGGTINCTQEMSTSPSPTR